MAALDMHGPPPVSGDPLPPLFHRIYFWDPQPPHRLGQDGHPRTGGLIPDLGLPRRMWAGGRLTFHAPFLAGVRAERTSRVISVTRKEGRTGVLGFVTLRHDIRQRSAVVVTEDQDLVYRPADAPPGSPSPAPGTAEDTRQVTFDSTLLFRYSALTLNGHRIHYDAEYARDSEGYDGLVVHGPLLAQVLMLMAVDRQGPLKTFGFRATSAVCLPESVTLCARDADYWVRGSDGRVCMLATAT